MPVFSPIPTEWAYFAMVSMPRLERRACSKYVSQDQGMALLDINLPVVLVTGEEVAVQRGASGALHFECSARRFPASRPAT